MPATEFLSPDDAGKLGEVAVENINASCLTQGFVIREYGKWHIILVDTKGYCIIAQV